MTTPRIRFYRVNKETPFPSKAFPTDSGYDICWWDETKEFTDIFPKQAAILNTGIYLSFPVGYEVQVRSKSGLSLRGITVANSPGTIDYGYSGEVKIILLNHTPRPYEIARGTKIAQLVLCELPIIQTESKYTADLNKIQEYLKLDFYEEKHETICKELAERERVRGTGGIGSTGDFMVGAGDLMLDKDNQEYNK